MTRWAKATDTDFAAKWGFEDQNQNKESSMAIPRTPPKDLDLFPQIGDDWDVEVDDPDNWQDPPIYGGERNGIAQHLIAGRYTGVATAPQGFEALVHVVVTDDGKALVSDLNDPQGEAHPDNAGPELYASHEELLAENDAAQAAQPRSGLPTSPPAPLQSVFEVDGNSMDGLDAFQSRAGATVTNPMLESNDPIERQELPPYQPSDATLRAQAWAEGKLAAQDDQTHEQGSPELD